MCCQGLLVLLHSWVATSIGLLFFVRPGWPLKSKVLRVDYLLELGGCGLLGKVLSILLFWPRGGGVVSLGEF